MLGVSASVTHAMTHMTLLLSAFLLAFGAKSVIAGDWRNGKSSLVRNAATLRSPNFVQDAPLPRG